MSKLARIYLNENPEYAFELLKLCLSLDSKNYEA